jgi:xylulokinase
MSEAADRTPTPAQRDGATIGLDIGTTNVKAALLNADGAVVAEHGRVLSMQRTGERAEQDAGDLWNVVLATLAHLRDDAPDTMSTVATIGVCSQYSSTVAVDAALEPVAPMRLYLDTRGTPHCTAVLERHPDSLFTWMERHPIPPIGGGLALGHLLSLQLDDAALFERTHTWLEPGDFVTTRLTGRPNATQVSMFASQLVDSRQLGVTDYDAELVSLSGVDPSRLPPLVRSGTPLEKLRSDVASHLGISGEVVVLPAITDSHAAALATGADHGRRIGAAFGTTGVLVATTHGVRIDADHDIVSMPGLTDGEWLVWAENGLAGRAVEQVLRTLLASDVLGDHRGDPFAHFDRAVANSSAGAGGVVFLPWLSGSMSPAADPNVRGGFLGMSLDTSRVDLVRATAEGVLHNLAWLLAPVEEFTGTPCAEIIATGGLARSDGWCQLAASVLDRPLRALARPSFSGARAVACWAAGRRAGADGLLGSEFTHSFEPDPQTSERYLADRERFVALFEALRPFRFPR